MKVDVSSTALSEAVARVSAVVNPRSEMPLLAHIELATDGDRLVVSATDLFVQIRCTIPTHQIHEPGSVIVHGKTLRRVVTSLATPDVTLEAVAAGATDGSKYALSIRSGRRKLSVHTLVGQDFPANKRPESDPVTLPGELVSQALGAVEHAVATDLTRENLCQVDMSICDGKIVTKSADGHRAARYTDDCEADAYSARIILKAIRPIISLCRIKDDGEFGDVEFSRSENWIFVSANGIEIAAQEQPRELPQIHDIIASVDARDPTVVGASELNQTVAGVLSLGSQHAGGLFQIDDGHISIRLEDSALGEAEDACAAVSAGSHAIGIDLNYLSDVLKQFSGDVSIAINGELDPILFFDDHLSAVVMPKRI